MTTRTIPPLLPWQPCLLAYAAGILAVGYTTAALCALALLVLFPRPAARRPRTPFLAAAFALGLAAGLLALPSPPPNVPACLDAATPVRVTGRVEEVDPRPDGRLSMTLGVVALTGAGCEAAPLAGRLALAVDHPTFRPVAGDVLAVSGSVRPTTGFNNPGTTDFAFLRRLDGVFFRSYARGDRGQVERITESGSFLARWREALRCRVAASLAPPENADAAARAGRAMVVALLFGDRSGLTESDIDLVRRASLSHTLALSGMHVGFVAAIGIALATLLGRLFPGLYLRLPRPHLIVLLAGPLVAAYCWLGGISPSLLRAALMFAAFGLMLLLRRDKALLDGLFLALAAILAVWPLAAFDVRLQLSALAVAGIGLFWPLFPGLTRHIPISGRMRTILAWGLGILWTSLCAEAAVLPIVSRVFGDWTPNPWINLLWLPVLGGVAMPLALTGLAATVLPATGPLGGWLLTAAAWCCEGLMRVLGFLDAHHLLLSQAVLRPWWPELLGCFGLLTALALVLSGRPRPVAAMLISLALLIGPTVRRAMDDNRERVSLTVLDVGQGQSVALALPGGRRLLVDAGGLFGNFDVGRAIVGAFLTDGRPPRLDMAFASHPHRDHVKGYVSLLERFDVGRYYDNGGPPEGDLAAPIENTLAGRHIPHAALAADDHLDLGHGLSLEVLHPGPSDDRSGNNGSLVLRLTWNGQGLAVIPGDAERPVLQRLAESGVDLSAVVLVMPHHGSVSSLSRRFYAAVAPRIAIASAGETWHYPSQKVLDALARLSCATYATNRDGAVTVRFDGPETKPKVEVEVKGEKEHASGGRVGLCPSRTSPPGGIIPPGPP